MSFRNRNNPANKKFVSIEEARQAVFKQIDIVENEKEAPKGREIGSPPNDAAMNILENYTVQYFTLLQEQYEFSFSIRDVAQEFTSCVLNPSNTNQKS